MVILIVTQEGEYFSRLIESGSFLRRLFQTTGRSGFITMASHSYRSPLSVTAAVTREFETSSEVTDEP
jgi:hypothetical protein